MKVIVTARHCDITDEWRERAKALIARAAKKAGRVHRAEVIFNQDHDRRIVEFQLSLPRGRMKVSTAEAGDFRTALDRAAEKIENHLDKIHPGATRRVTG